MMTYFSLKDYLLFTYYFFQTFEERNLDGNVVSVVWNIMPHLLALSSYSILFTQA